VLMSIDCTVKRVASSWKSIVLAVTSCFLLAIRVIMNLKGGRHMNNMINVLIDAANFLKGIGPLLVAMLPT